MLSKSSIIRNQYENVSPKVIILKAIFWWPFFLKSIKLIMSKRYSGKSFKDSSVKKKPKLSFKEKRKLKKDKQKKTN